jgi:hypothetical protein
MDYNQKVANDQSKNLGIDFDGVIHNDNLGFHDGTVYGEPIEGSLESIKLLSEFFNIIIFTAKAKKDRPLIDGKSGAELVEEWLLKHDVLKFVSDVTAEKPRALLYIDDKGFRFENWQDTMNFIKSINEI